MANRRSIVAAIEEVRTDLSFIRRLTRFGPWVASLAIIVPILAVSALACWRETTVIRELRTSSLAPLGLTASETSAGLILTWDESRFRIGECRTASGSIPCLAQQPEK